MYHRLLGRGRYLSGRSSGGVCFFGFFLPCEAFILTCVNALRLFFFSFPPLNFFFFFFPSFAKGERKEKKKMCYVPIPEGGETSIYLKSFFFFYPFVIS